MKLSTLRVASAALPLAFAIVTVTHFFLGSPDPTGSGYVYTVNGIKQGVAQHASALGDAGFCPSLAGWTTDGAVVATTNPYCCAGGGACTPSISSITPNRASAAGSLPADIRITGQNLYARSVTFGGVPGSCAISTTGRCYGFPFGECLLCTSPACDVAPNNCVLNDGVGTVQTVAVSTDYATANSSGSPLNDFWFMCQGFNLDWNAQVADDDAGHPVEGGVTSFFVPDHSPLQNTGAITPGGDAAAPPMSWVSTGGGTGSVQPYLNFTSNSLVSNMAFPASGTGIAAFFTSANGVNYTLQPASAALIFGLSSSTQFQYNGEFSLNALYAVQNAAYWGLLHPIVPDTDFGAYALYNGASSVDTAQGLSASGTALSAPESAGIGWGNSTQAGANLPFIGRGYDLVSYPASALPSANCVTNWAAYHSAMGFTP